MKLNRRKIRQIIRQKQEGVSSKEIAKDIGISRRRVNQIWKYFREHGHEPIIGKDVGRPRKPYDEREAQIVRGDAHQRFKFGARMLEVILDKMYNVAISHNRIHVVPSDSGTFSSRPKETEATQMGQV